MTGQQKLEAFADRELPQLQENLIIHEGPDSYFLFGKYRMTYRDSCAMVKCAHQQPEIFSNKRTAISWCVADKYKQHKLADSIKWLDSRKQSLVADIKCRQQVARSSRNREFQTQVLTKLQHKVAQVVALDAELEKCLNSAKYWQIKGFSHETARSGRTAAVKTNR
jgi:hypothetical protein